MDKGLTRGFISRPRHSSFLCLILSLFLIASHMVVFFLGTVYGWDRGYDVAIKQVASALKEQINEGRTFRLKNIDIKFYPRKEGSTNYALAGAGADVPVKK